MCENIFKELLGEMMESELAEFDNAPDRKTSLRHRLAMRRIFARYERNVQKLKEKTVEQTTLTEPQHSRLNFKQRIILALVIVLLMTLLVGWVNMFVSKDFYGIVHADNTHLFVVNTENAPTSIEYTYSLNDVPDGFQLVEVIPSQTNIYTKYHNNITDQTITLSQWVKSHYKPHLNTEHNSIEKIDINGYEGLCMGFSDDERQSSVILWDNGDYVLEIFGNMAKNSVMNLAKSTKISENQQVRVN